MSAFPNKLAVQFVTGRIRLRHALILAALSFFSLASQGQTLLQSLDATNLTWTTSGTGGSPGWAGQTGISQDGVSAAKSILAAPNSNPQTAILQTTVTGPGTLTFWWSGSAPDSDGSQLSFSVSGTNLLTVTDFSHWTQQTVYVGTGAQTLKWTFSLPTFAPGGAPGYVDQVTWTKGSTPPLIQVPPVSQSVIPGGNATFYVGSGGTPPMNYQWQLKGTNLPNATNSSYSITGAQTGNLGNYRVVLSNGVGTNTSSAATLEFGQLAVWGFSSVLDSRGTAPLGATNVHQISGGFQHNLLLHEDGTLLSWGSTNAAQPTLATGPGLLHASAFNGGGVFLRGNGTVSAWGNTGLTNIPANLTGVVAIAQGPTASYCLALRSDGTVVGWGGGSVINVPASVSNIVSVAAGELHAVALRSDGILTTWGDNSYNQSRVPNAVYFSYPTNKVVAVAAGGMHTLVLKADGTVMVWGYNSSGQTNLPSTAKGVTAIAAGMFHSLALRTNGSVVAWGGNTYGQTIIPAALTNASAIAAGAFHSLAILGNGSPTLAAVDGASYSTNGFSFTLPGHSGRVFEAAYKTSLKATNWTALPYVAGNGGHVIITDNTASDSQRFYRVRRW